MYKVFILLTLIFSASAFGADVVDHKLLEKNLEAANTQIEVLKAQVELMKNYQDNFLSTVYWSLGAVVSIVLLLIGINWFTNVRNQERDLQLLKDSINNEVNNLKLTIKQNLDEKNAEYMKNLNLNFNNKIESLSDSLSEKINRSTNSLKNKVADLNNDILNLEYEKWMREGVYVNALRAIIEILKVEVHPVRKKYIVEEAFEKIEEVFEKIKENEAYYNVKPEVIKNLLESFDPLEKNYSITITKFKETLADFNSKKKF